MDEVYKDAFDMLAGKLIGQGSQRKVFECKLRPELVVKIEDKDYRAFSNVREMMFWSDNQYRETVAKWLAPCEFLSPDGRVLLQKRADPLPRGYKLPEKMPHFLTDFKRENFGLIDGKLVCIDYGLTIDNVKTNLKKADWWSVDS